MPLIISKATQYDVCHAKLSISLVRLRFRRRYAIHDRLIRTPCFRYHPMLRTLEAIAKARRPSMYPESRWLRGSMLFRHTPETIVYPFCTVITRTHTILCITFHPPCNDSSSKDTRPRVFIAVQSKFLAGNCFQGPGGRPVRDRNG